jgi:hypothetical protein
MVLHRVYLSQVFSHFFLRYPSSFSLSLPTLCHEDVNTQTTEWRMMQMFFCKICEMRGELRGGGGVRERTHVDIFLFEGSCDIHLFSSRESPHSYERGGV